MLIRRISRELGVDFKELGELVVAFDEEELRGLYQLKKDAELPGVPGVEIVGPALHS